MHFFFTFTLTLLIYKNLLNSCHTRAFLGAMIFLMITRDIFEWIVGIRVPDSMFVAGLDITMDLLAGFLGTIMGIKRSPPKLRLASVFCTRQNTRHVIKTILVQKPYLHYNLTTIRVQWKIESPSRYPGSFTRSWVR